MPDIASRAIGVATPAEVAICIPHQPPKVGQPTAFPSQGGSTGYGSHAATYFPSRRAGPTGSTVLPVRGAGMGLMFLDGYRTGAITLCGEELS